MGSLLILTVSLSTLSLATGSPQLFGLELVDHPGDSGPGISFVNSLKSEHNNNGGGFPGANYGGLDSSVEEPASTPVEDHRAFYSSAGPGPLHYGKLRAVSEEQLSRLRDSPAEESPASSDNDLSSLYGGVNSSPSQSDSERPSLSDFLKPSNGYKPGLPPGFSPGKRPRGPPPGVENSPPSYLSSGGRRKRPRNLMQSLPMRIGRGIMNLFTSATSSIPSATLPDFFSPPKQPQVKLPLMITSGSDDNESTFYLAPPPRDSPSFYKMKRPFKKPRNTGSSALSYLKSSSSDSSPQYFLINSPHSQAPSKSVPYSGSKLVSYPGIEHLVTRGPPRGPPRKRPSPPKFRTAPPPQGAVLNHLVNPYASIVAGPPRTKISKPNEPESQSQLVMIDGPDGSPILYRVPFGHSVVKLKIPQSVLSQSSKGETGNAVVEGVDSKSESQEGEDKDVLVLASRPDVPFPSLTNADNPQNNGLSTQIPVQYPGFTLTGAQSVFSQPASPLVELQQPVTYVNQLGQIVQSGQQPEQIIQPAISTTVDQQNLQFVTLSDSHQPQISNSREDNV